MLGDEDIKGDVVAVGGSAHVEGIVEGSVVAIGGSVDLGPRARVDRDVVVIGGTLHRDPSAVVKGDIKEIGVGAMTGLWGAPVDWMGRWNRRVWAPSFALASTLTRSIVLLVMCALVMLFGSGYVERVGARAAAEPLKAGAIGLLAQLLFVPLLVITVVVLVATLIGIPLVLVPFARLSASGSSRSSASPPSRTASADAWPRSSGSCSRLNTFERLSV